MWLKKKILCTFTRFLIILKFVPLHTSTFMWTRFINTYLTTTTIIHSTFLDVWKFIENMIRLAVNYVQNRDYRQMLSSYKHFIMFECLTSVHYPSSIACHSSPVAHPPPVHYLFVALTPSPIINWFIPRAPWFGIKQLSCNF